MKTRINLNLFLKEAFFFVLTQVLGVFIVLRVYQIPELRETVEAQASELSPIQFLLSFLIVTLIFLLLLPLFKKSPIFLKVLFGLSLLVGLDVLIGAFLGEPRALIFSFVLVILINFYPKIIFHNILFSCSLAGIGALLATSFSPIAVIIILTVLSVYDLVAVYLTRHMVKMAKIPAEKGVFFGLVLPKKTAMFLKDKPALKLGKKSDLFLLGGGDIVLPMVLVGSVAKTNLVDGIIVGLFSLLGLFLMNLLFSFREKGQAMPGLPPLVLMSVLGYLLITLI